MSSKKKEEEDFHQVKSDKIEKAAKSIQTLLKQRLYNAGKKAYKIVKKDDEKV